MGGRARLSSDVSEIKLVFSIPPHPRVGNVKNNDPGLIEPIAGAA